jgi:spore maturation protein CgeB
MRWLVVAPGPSFSVWDLHVGWCEALRERGEQVFEFPLGDVMTFYSAMHIDKGDGYQRAVTDDQAITLATDRLAAALFKIRPHVMLIISGFFTDLALLEQARRLGTKVVVAHTEEPYELSRGLALAPHVDLNLLNDPTNLAQYQAVAPTEYMPHAYRPKIHRPGPVDMELLADFAFAGTGYPSRVKFFAAMDFDGLTVNLAGNWMALPEGSSLRRFVCHDLDECFDNEDAVELYRSATVGLNLYRREAEAEHLVDGWSMSPREVEMAATGLFFLRDPRGEGDEVLDMLPTFASPEDASEQLRYWLAHDDERQALAGKAREAVADRTFHAHAATLLRLLDRQPAHA